MKRNVDPQEIAYELAEIGLLSQRQAEAYVYQNVIDDPDKSSEAVFDVPEAELNEAADAATKLIDAAKKAKQMEASETPLGDQQAVLAGSGLLTEAEAESYRHCRSTAPKTAAEIVGRSKEAVQKEAARAETKIEQSKKTIKWLTEHPGAEVY